MDLPIIGGAFRHRRPSRPFLQQLLSRVFSTFLRLLLVAVGFFFALLLLALGVAATLALLVWSLLRGRRPRIIRFGGVGGSPFGAPRHEPAAGAADVVDIEAREVPDAPPPRLPGDTPRAG